jgi:hypothetical protein
MKLAETPLQQLRPAAAREPFDRLDVIAAVHHQRGACSPAPPIIYTSAELMMVASPNTSPAKAGCNGAPSGSKAPPAIALLPERREADARPCPTPPLEARSAALEAAWREKVDALTQERDALQQALASATAHTDALGSSAAGLREEASGLAAALAASRADCARLEARAAELERAEVVAVQRQLEESHAQQAAAAAQLEQERRRSAALAERNCALTQAAAVAEQAARHLEGLVATLTAGGAAPRRAPALGARSVAAVLDDAVDQAAEVPAAEVPTAAAAAPLSSTRLPTEAGGGRPQGVGAEAALPVAALQSAARQSFAPPQSAQVRPFRPKRQQGLAMA